MNENYKLYSLYFFCLIYILFTTNFLNDHQLIYVYGQTDILQYYMLAENFPNLPDGNKKILGHISARFIVPYIAGSISYLTELNLFNSFKLINGFFLMIYIFFINIFLKNYNCTSREKFLFFCLIFLNPYIVRHHLFQPVQAHDLLFFSLTLIYLLGLIKEKFLFISISSILMIFLRQTSIAFFIGTIFYFFMSKKKNYINLITYIIAFIFLYKLNSMVGYMISDKEFSLKYAYGIFLYDFNQIEKLIKFLAMPLISFFPLLCLILYSRKLRTDVNIVIILTCFLITIMMVGQPILGGPEFTQRNVVRISTLSYVVATFFVIYTFDLKNFTKKNIIYFTFILGLFIWSLHPLFSKVKIFSVLRF